MNLRRSAILILALLSLPLLSSCVRVLNPTGWSAVVFDGNTAYLTTSKGRISSVTVDGDSATANWTFPDKDRKEDSDLKLKAIYGAPVLDGDRLYLGTFAGGVFALRTDDGRPIWPGVDGNQQKISGDLAGGIVMAGDRLFFGTTEGRLYGWNKADGSPATGWEEPKKLKGGIWAAPVVVGDAVFAATTDGGLHAFSVSDGRELWSGFKASGAVVELSAVNDDLLFVPSINHHVYLVKTADGSIAADFKANDWVWSNGAVAGNHLFFGDFSGSVFGLDISGDSVTEMWDPVKLDGEHVRAAPAIIGDVLVVADRKPVVTFINIKDGTVMGNRVPLQDAGTVRADLVVRDGAAYISTTNGKLFRAEPDNFKVVEVVLSGVKK
ncbi:MAG: PQQ-binding-like beta-propeller repeat protein [Dehalococcoidia bacterium]